MVNSGIVRKLDNLGRIVIPMELRKVMGLEVGTPVEIYVEGEIIMLKKYQPSCIFCGEAFGVIDYKGKKICKKCFTEIKQS